MPKLFHVSFSSRSAKGLARTAIGTERVTHPHRERQLSGGQCAFADGAAGAEALRISGTSAAAAMNASMIRKKASE